ncbi:hypothetical protein Skr01_31130 [Sphaerisporangium krabiense]|uniref:Uncharacterized protein n=1 Tax=Sphaerisporangium krabiense TaxID=763782 RepID=A0A7W8Z1B1_9ACTN|nr:hypothetical protein [Sphaerisporangium krabiense]MBB5625636.1 hypothetical protein [Sphaerisporangium krabiense]GII63028.1 hypothetical protein Skr01_31130 [Sphaerisporangium krabiense]
MTNEVTESKAAARALAARMPGWTVWYGEHTRRFWAIPRSAVPAGTRMAEADTVEELEEVVRRMMGAPPRQLEAPAARPETAAGQVPMPGPAPQQHRQPVATG